MTPRADYQMEFRLAPDEIIVDSFAGGGGASEGIRWALGRDPHIAINHDKEAIALHRANHPDSEHYPEDVWHVDPTTACQGRKVGLMWLSPDCKHFSKAKGGKPVSKKIRGLAWTACRWAKAVKPRVIVLENVEEFEDWGPLYPANHRIKKLRNMPIRSKKGQTFKSFVSRLRRLGYQVQWRKLRACDYGAPTIRNRFFLIARCDGQEIVWPTPTHGKGLPRPWRTAAECIDWSHECPSIFERKKELADNTLRRIARGIQRYVIDSPSPFIVGVGGRMSQTLERSVGQPCQTITGKADAAIVLPHITPFVLSNMNNNVPTGMGHPVPTITSGNKNYLTAPVIVPTAHQGDARAHSVEQPVTTITGGKRGDHALVAPHLIRVSNGERDASGKKRGKGENDLADPLPTQMATNSFGLVAPFLKARYGEAEGQEPRARSIELPAPTIVPTGNGGDLVATYLAKHHGGNEATGQSLEDPMHTIAGHINKALVTSHLSKFYGTCADGQDVREPMPTVTANNRGGGHIAEVRAFLISFYGTDQNTGELHQPAPTVTSKDRFGLVTVDGTEYVIADIGMRMLQPRELYTAQGFPPEYQIDIEYNGKPMTKTAQVRMCGNSVCPPLAAAIVAANVGSASIILERGKVA